MTNSDNPVAGWYADPLDPQLQRRWDGQRWTDETRPGAVEAPTPEPEKRAGARRLVPAVVLLAAAVGAGTLAFGSNGGASPRLYVHDDPERGGAVHMLALDEDITRDNVVIDRADSANAITPWGRRSDDVVLSVRSGSGNSWETGAVRDGEFVDAVRSDQTPALSYVAGRIVLHDYSDSTRCYAGDSWDDLELISRSGSCLVSADASLYAAHDYDSGDRTYEIDLFDRAGSRIRSLDSVTYGAVSADGDLVAVSSGSPGRETLEVISVSSGEVLREGSRADNINIVGFVGADVIYRSYGDDGWGEHVRLDGDGREETIGRSSQWSWALLLEDANVLAIEADGPGSSREMSFFDARSGEPLGSVVGSWISVAEAGEGDDRWAVLIADEGRGEVHLGRGAARPELAIDHRLSSPSPHSVWFGEGGTGGYSFTDWTGSTNRGLIGRLDWGDMSGELLDDDLGWPTIWWWSDDGRRVVASSNDDGSELVLLQSDERTEVLDDARWFNGLGVVDGRAYYTASDDGGSDVRSVDLSGDERAETVHRDARLLTVEGSEVNGIQVHLAADGH